MKKTLLILAMTVISLITYAQIPTNGLIAWYPLTGNAVDSSGNGNDGTVVGSPVLVTGHDGIPYSAYEFNSDTSNATINAIALPAIAVLGDAPFSVFCWVKTPDYQWFYGPYVNPFISLGNSTWPAGWNYSPQLALSLATSNLVSSTVNLRCYGTSISFGTLLPHTWHFIGLTYDNTHTFRLFVDSVYALETANLMIYIQGQDNNFIGHNDYNEGFGLLGLYHSTFRGAVDNVMYFGRVLDSTEIVSCRDFPSIITSVNDIVKEKLSIEVYPNPSNGSFQIMSSAKSGTFQLYNTLGNIVNQGRLEEKVTLNEIPLGFYLLKVYANGIVQEKKVVVCK